LISNWTGGMVPVPDIQDVAAEVWWLRVLSPLTKKQQRSTAALLMYTTWNIWKEHNRCVFESKLLQPSQGFELIKEEVNLRRVACGIQLLE
ncbi:hypothetical protein BAE44_0003906, partial [Dichanthelium oligosanthes]